VLDVPYTLVLPANLITFQRRTAGEGCGVHGFRVVGGRPVAEHRSNTVVPPASIARGHAEGLMHPAEVVVHEVQRDGRLVVEPVVNGGGD